MADFNIGRAATAGFRIVGKRPVTVFVWGLVYLLIAVVPSLLLIGTAAPGFMELMKQAAAGADPHNSAGAMQTMASMQAMQPISMLTGIVARAIIVAAVFRAVLEPMNRGAFSLRLGMDEVWQGLVHLCLGVFLFFVVLGVVLVFGMIGGASYGVAAAASGSASAQPWMLPVAIAACVLLFVVIIWLCLRFSMAPPMTFAQKTFRLFESWGFTRGRTGSLFLTALLTMILAIAVELVMAAIIGVLLVGGIAAAAAMTDLQQVFSRPPAEWLPALGLAGVIAVPIFVFFTGVMTTIAWAPWADAYRQIAGEPAAPGDA